MFYNILFALHNMCYGTSLLYRAPKFEFLGCYREMFAFLSRTFMVGVSKKLKSVKMKISNRWHVKNIDPRPILDQVSCKEIGFLLKKVFNYENCLDSRLWWQVRL